MTNSEQDLEMDSRQAANMEHLRPRKRQSYNVLGKRSGTISGSPMQSSQCTTYHDSTYLYSLKLIGVFMDEFPEGVTRDSKEIVHRLLATEQVVPENSLFRDDLFKLTCQMIAHRNETRVVRDISLLIVPSAELLAVYGETHLKCLTETTNEAWSKSIPVAKSRPQPDYSVGFRPEAFTNDQCQRLQPFLGGKSETSHFEATNFMWFPFLACEVKCGMGSLEIADRQNIHSMFMAVRGIVELFRCVKREKELDREILAFSISHNHRHVRIYGHYPVIDGNDTTFYRHPIYSFDFTTQDGKEKWTTYKFTRNVYDIWMPMLLKRICSAIDEIPPDFTFEDASKDAL